MYTIHRNILFPALLLALSVLVSSGCSASAGSSSAKSSDSDRGGTRPNTPVVYEPAAPGTEVLGSSPLTVDISNRSQGYVMAKYTGGSAKANIQITGSDGISYKYFLPPSEEYIPLPLTAGSGGYQIDGYENISGTKYAVLFRESMNVKLDSEFLPFLYPNQYVDFNSETEAVSTAADIVAGADTDLDAVADIYHYVISHVTYDDAKAASVESGYLPDVDETLRTGKGICFDYASLTAAMLRSQDIPVRLEIGYSGDVYHAWISVHIEDKGWIDDIIEFSGNGWTRMDPTFASGNDNSKNILKYIGDGSNYTTQYIR